MDANYSSDAGLLQEVHRCPGLFDVFEDRIQDRFIFTQICARGVIAAPQCLLAIFIRAAGGFFDDAQFLSEREGFALARDASPYIMSNSV